MKTLIANFSNHLSSALSIGRDAALAPPRLPIHNVLISGMGGSGIGGTIVSQLTANESAVPVNVAKDYFIPAYVNEQTLVIISSYSGNTEETLSAMKQACVLKAEIVCITSGGEVLEMARKHKFNHIVIPGGMPPRACLGYSFTQLFYVLHHYKIINRGFEKDISSSIALLNKEEENIRREALETAKAVHGKIPVIYTTASNEGVGIRLRQQLNENYKMLCWHHVFPEMNHNELVGWRKKNQDLAVLMFRSDTDYSRVKKRMEICKPIFSKCTSTLIEIHAKGQSEIEKTLYFIHFGDWLSYYLSELNKADAMEIEVINFLKSEIAKTD